jgi:LPXTG-motif cell wall-anchored protein
MGSSPLTRLAALVATIALMAPASAFAQGAGDDQYQDPFPDTPTQTQPDDGLRDEPPGGGSGGSGGGAGSGGGSGSGSDGGAETPAQQPAPGAQAAAADGSQLPNTGGEPLWLAVLGAGMLLAGTGLRLRTIDPDAY